MKPTDKQIEELEEMFDCAFEDLSEYTVQSHIASQMYGLPNWNDNIGKYYNPDDISMTISDVHTLKDFKSPHDISIYVKDSKVLTKFYEMYNEQITKLTQIIMDIDFDYFSKIDCNYEVCFSCKVKTNLKYIIDTLSKTDFISCDVDTDIPYEFIVTKYGNNISIKNNFNLNIFKK